jgi:hypothetical protein
MNLRTSIELWKIGNKLSYWFDKIRPVDIMRKVLADEIWNENNRNKEKGFELFAVDNKLTQEETMLDGIQ